MADKLTSFRHIETYGRKIATWRITAVTATGTALTIPDDVSHIHGLEIHREGTVPDFLILGTVGAGAAAAFYKDGASRTIDIAARAGDTICTLYAPGSDTYNFSIVAWQ